MATQKSCDVCKNPTERIVAKLFFAPNHKARRSNAIHSNYTHHCDVGICCVDRLLKGFNFRPRKTAQEYHDSRKNGG